MTAHAATARTVLEARNLRLAYRHAGGSRVVLDDLSLRLEAGQIMAVLGPSGIGKSSLLRVLAGLQAPDGGSVHVASQPLAGAHPRAALVFQSPCLLPWLDVVGNVAFGLAFRRQPQLTKAARAERVRTAIAEVGLEHARELYPEQLSGGMAQRTALARALARLPALLLLDEPFSALDAVTRADMQALLRGVTRRHRTATVLVTHDIDEALAVADRVVVLGGPPGQLLAYWDIGTDRHAHAGVPHGQRLRAQIVRALSGESAAVQAAA